MNKNPAQNQDRPAMAEMRSALPVSMAWSISQALDLMASGRIEQARRVLEDGLCYADVTHPGVAKEVGLNSVRGGKGF